MSPETVPYTAMDQALALVFLGFTAVGVILVVRYIIRVYSGDEDDE